MAKIVLSNDGALVTQRFLEEDPVSIGRAPGSDIVVDDAHVADVHACISVVGNDYILEGEGLGGGVSVNGNLLARRILQHGDVIELGAFSLKFVDTKASSQIDLDRTMLIPGLARPAPGEEATQDLHVPSSRISRVHLPEGRVERLEGGERGAVQALDRIVATFGTPGVGVAVITRRPRGYFVTHVEGEDYPRVNGESIGREPRALASGDTIEVARDKLRFTQLA